VGFLIYECYFVKVKIQIPNYELYLYLFTFQISNANNCYRLSDLLSIIRRDTLGASIVRCRQYANKNQYPVRSIFTNVSMDSFKSPTPNENLSVLLSNGPDTRIQSWILAISNPEV
jgi:hypothetical protein